MTDKIGDFTVNKQSLEPSDPTSVDWRVILKVHYNLSTNKNIKESHYNLSIKNNYSGELILFIYEG